MKVVTVVGARPQFVKAAVVSLAFREFTEVEELVVHTGQHYDPRMSQVFFDELGIPQPAHNLRVGSGKHGEQTGLMLGRLEEVMLAESPRAVLVYGDTNSTLAGALAAVKLHVPVVHVEAGLRSFNRRMPEEINRVVADHVSTLLLCPTPDAVKHLANEGITRGVHLVGDVMYDCALRFADLAQSRVSPLRDFGLRSRGYILMTCHRAENTDDPARLEEILKAANRIAQDLPILFPVHPRARKQFAAVGVRPHPNLRMVDPVSYFEMLLLEREATLILTDSGGVQKEAFFYGVPCVTIRGETEWMETVEVGANRVEDGNADRIVEAVRAQLDRKTPLPDAGAFYGQGKASQRTAKLIAEMETGSQDG